MVGNGRSAKIHVQQLSYKQVSISQTITCTCGLVFHLSMFNDLTGVPSRLDWSHLGSVNLTHGTY